jgi:hypothetical protein
MERIRTVARLVDETGHDVGRIFLTVSRQLFIRANDARAELYLRGLSQRSFRIARFNGRQRSRAFRIVAERAPAQLPVTAGSSTSQYSSPSVGATACAGNFAGS